MRKKVIYLCGISFCGSTIMGLVANTHPHVFHVGELANITTRYWKNASDYRKGDTRYETSCCSNCAGHKLECPIFPMRDIPIPENEIYHYVFDKVDCIEGIFDTSKSITYGLEQKNRFPEYDFYYVFLLKDPVLQARSYIYRNHYPLTNDITNADKWFNYYLLHNGECLSGLENSNVSYSIIDYNDFASRPADILSKVAIEANIPNEKFDPILAGSGFNHYIHGNFLLKNMNSDVRPTYGNCSSEEINCISLSSANPLLQEQINAFWKTISSHERRLQL